MIALAAATIAAAEKGLSVQDWASVLKDSATVLALVVGGLFTYFKFIKGRVIGPRATLALSTRLLSPPGRRERRWIWPTPPLPPAGRAIGIELCIHNAGQIQLRLARDTEVLVAICSITARAAFGGGSLTQLAQSWKQSDAYFAETNLMLEEGLPPAADVPLEPGEDARFAAVFPVPASHRPAAYLITVNCRIGYRSWFRKRERWWDSRTLVIPEGTMPADAKVEVSG